MQMLTDDEALSRAAGDVLADITAMPKVDSRDEFDAHRVRTRDGISRLVSRGKQHL